MVTFTSLFSGSSKNASLISSDNLNILIDCGGSMKSINDKLKTINKTISDITHIFITHSHTDHISALSTILKNNDVKVFASLGTHEELFDMGISMHKENRIVLYPDTFYDLNGFTVNGFVIPHDTSEPFGYNFIIEDKRITLATDIGYIFDGMESKILAHDLLFFESNHDIDMLKSCNRPLHLVNRILGKKGHLCNKVSAEFTLKLAKNGLKRLMLGHLSNDANTVDLAYNTTKNLFESNCISVEKDIELYIAKRDEMSKTLFL